MRPRVARRVRQAEEAKDAEAKCFDRFFQVSAKNVGDDGDDDDNEGEEKTQSND